MQNILRLLEKLAEYVAATPYCGVNSHDIDHGKLLNPSVDDGCLLFAKVRHCSLDSGSPIFGMTNYSTLIFSYRFNPTAQSLTVTNVTLEEVVFDWESKIRVIFDDHDTTDDFVIRKQDGRYSLTGTLSRELGSAASVEELRPLVLTLADGYVDSVLDGLTVKDMVEGFVAQQAGCAFTYNGEAYPTPSREEVTELVHEYLSDRFDDAVEELVDLDSEDA